MKVYLAGRFSRLPELVGYADELESFGITCTSRWLRGGHEWVGTDDDEIPVERLAQFAREDIENIDDADFVVCFTEPARIGPMSGGRHFEAGYAYARGKPLIVVGRGRENIFYCLPEVIFRKSWVVTLQMLVRWNDDKTKLEMWLEK